MRDTFLSSVLASLQKAAEYNKDDTVPPAAVLWPDEKREWERLLPRLRAELPHLFVFGPYDPDARTGPAIWLRCVLAGKIPDAAAPAGAIPILYLPGVSRATLRVTEDCPAELRPLAELQYRGAFWSQLSTKDWTVTAFLQSEKGGLNLTLAKDQATANSVRRALEKLADVPVAELVGKSSAGELNSFYFDSLISDDPVGDLLLWLSDPKGTRERWEADRWETLCNRCKADYGFDPVRDGELAGAEQLGTQPKPAWKAAWKRFVENPTRYAGLEPLMRKAKPSGGITFAEEMWPQDNEDEENELRQAFQELASASVPTARQTLIDLETRHGPRRDWPWAKLNRSPLAVAAQHLAALAAATASALTGATPADMVAAYTGGGWKADAATLDALAAVSRHADQQAVRAAVAHVYTPWLRDAAELFQQRVAESPLPGRETPRLDPVPIGTCVLFVDGLRYDVGQKFLSLLLGRVGSIGVQHQYVALPSVTPTAKPAVSPIAAALTGTAAGEDFRPCTVADGKELTPDRFRKLLADEGVQFVDKDATGEPTGRGWTEFGDLDKKGHDEGVNLARRIPELLSSLVQRVEALLAAGWQEVRVVTDHGWLLVPGGLPKCELPKYLVETRWGRCAAVKPTSNVELPCVPWFWAEGVRVACPPGIGCFVAGKEYNHGGVSLQECVVPQYAIRPSGGPTVSATIASTKWTRLRCRVQAAGTFSGCKVDLRDKPADPTSTLCGAAKPVGADGTASLVVTDDAREGTATTVVLLDPAGNVVAKSAVTVGG
jgi:hypothetical protein